MPYRACRHAQSTVKGYQMSSNFNDWQSIFANLYVLWLDICNKIVGFLLIFLFTNDFLTLTYISICTTHDQHGRIVMRILLTNETYSIFIAKWSQNNLVWRFFYAYAIFEFIHVLLKINVQLRFFNSSSSFSINRKIISKADEFSVYAEGAKKD